MWFLPFSVMVTARGIVAPGYEIWFMNFIQKLLVNDRDAVRLLARNPFAGDPPKFIRALFYQYRYTSWAEKKQTGAWWTRQLIDTYLPPITVPYRKA
jgi:hypothetical protein